MVKDKVDEAIETFIDNPSPQISYHDLIRCLCELNKKDFKRIIKIAKSLAIFRCQPESKQP